MEEYHLQGSDEVIKIPIRDILGKQDECFAAGTELSKLCEVGGRVVMIHGGGHEAPKGPDQTAEMVDLIHGVVARTLFAQ